MWARISGSAVVLNSVQKRSLKLLFYQKEVKNNEICPFLIINIKKLA